MDVRKPKRKLFQGEYAVFSKQVPSQYRAEWRELGGRVARNEDQLSEALYFFCGSQQDYHFIKRYSHLLEWIQLTRSSWYNETFRVVTPAFLDFCLDEGWVPPGDLHSWAVNSSGFVVPTHTLLEWPGWDYQRSIPASSSPQETNAYDEYDAFPFALDLTSMDEAELEATMSESESISGSAVAAAAVDKDEEMPEAEMLVEDKVPAGKRRQSQIPRFVALGKRSGRRGGLLTPTQSFE
uniref:BRCT domain-containing protein n=1 Tax=Mycena chlorophos TaxID=658473 RepID=A0ABQ0KWM6_MYCCL|nr:predicted protein [Mycena chlorophos]